MSAFSGLPEASATWLSDCLSLLLDDTEPTRELIVTLDPPAEVAREAPEILACGESMGLLAHTYDGYGYLDDEGEGVLVDRACWWSLTEAGRSVAEAFDARDAVAADAADFERIVAEARGPVPAPGAADRSGPPPRA